MRARPIPRPPSKTGRSSVLHERSGAVAWCEERGTAACAKVRIHRFLVQERRVEYVQARRVLVPVGESGFFAAPGGILLKYLRPDGEHVLAAACEQLDQRVRVERHVVVEQERPVVAHAIEAALYRAREGQWIARMDEFDLRKLRPHAKVAIDRRAVGDDDDLVRLANELKRTEERGKRLGQHDRCIAIGDDDRESVAPCTLRAVHA